MSDPPRLLEGNGLAGSLLRAGTEELPSRDAVRKAAMAIGAGAAIASTGASVSAASGAAGIATGAGSVASKASAPLTLVVLGKWLGIGTLTGLVTVTSASQLEHRRSSNMALQVPAPARPASTSSPVATAATKADDVDVPAPPPIETGMVPSSNDVIRPARDAPRVNIVEPVSEAEGVRPSKRGPALQPVPAAQAESTAPLASVETLPPVPPRVVASDESSPAFAPEIAFVDRAWQAVQRGSYDDALAGLVGYELRFPDLRLHPEVLFLRMEAERRLGHDARAASFARQIVSIYPKSAQAARARSILGSR